MDLNFVLKGELPIEASSNDTDELIKRLNVNPSVGLNAVQVAERQFTFGMNTLDVNEDKSMWISFMDQFKDPLIGLLLASAGVSIIMGHYEDAISIAVAVTIVVSVAFIQEYRSEKSLEALNKLVPPACHCVRDGHKKDIEASELVPGDIVLINVGDRIPADCRLLEAIDLCVDESNLTGEGEPILKHSKPIANAGQFPIAERTNLVYMGTLVTMGRGRAIVFGTGRHSEFGAVFEVMQDVEERKTPLQHKMDALGKQLSVFSFAVIGCIVLLGLLQGRPFMKMFQIGVSLAVAAIPEGLPICVTVTLALGVIRMSKKHAILKKLPAVEALGCTNVVCVDKTGTMTQNEMTVGEIVVPYESVPGEVTGVGYSGEGQISMRGELVNKDNFPHIYNMLLAGALCCNAEIVHQKVVGQPTEGAIVVCAKKIGIDENILSKYTRVSEVPFSSDKKWMAVCCKSSESPQHDLWCLKGTPEEILERSDKLEDSKGNHKELCQADRHHVLTEAKGLASRGLRVLAVAYGDSSESGLIFGGLFGIHDPPRQGASCAVSRLYSCGVRTIMLTGDSKETASAISGMMGISTLETPDCLSGPQVDIMSMTDLQDRMKSVSVFYRTCPRHKLKIVRALQACDYVVAMTGDGVNDAPALKAADIGIAMGTSMDVSKEAADMILVDDNFSTILCAIEEGKSIFHNIKNFLRFQLSTSVSALSIITISTLFDLPNPLNAMQILWINIIMDGPPAQSLGVEKVDHDVMKEMPRAKDVAIITNSLIKRILVSACMIISGTLYVFYSGLERDDRGEWNVSRRDRTMSFTTFVFFDMFNALSCRSETKSIFRIGIFSNPTFVVSVSASLVGQLLVIYLPFLQSIFQTEALSLYDLFFIISLACSVFVQDEIRKCWNKLPHRRKGRALIKRNSLDVVV